MNLNELTLENIGSWPLAARISVIGFVCMIIFALFFAFDIRPIRHSIVDAKLQEHDLRSSYQVKYSQVINRAAYAQQVEMLQKEIKTILAELPNQLDIPQLIGDISKVGTQAGLQFNFIKPLPEAAHDYYTELPINISVTGNYAQLNQFIVALAKIPHIVTIDQFSISATNSNDTQNNASATSNPQSDLLVMELTAVTYKQSSQNQKNLKSIAEGAP